MILLLSRLVQLSGNEMKRQKKYIIFLVIGAVGYLFIAFVANNQGLLNP